MKLQKHISRKKFGKEYYKYVIVISEKLIKMAGFSQGDELKAEAKKGEIKVGK